MTSKHKLQNTVFEIKNSQKKITKFYLLTVSLPQMLKINSWLQKLRISL